MSNEYTVVDIPPNIWKQMLIYSIPMCFTAINSNFKLPNASCLILGFLSSAAGDLCMKFFNSYVQLMAANLLFFVCTCLSYIAPQYKYSFYFLSYGFSSNLLYNTQFLVTMDVGRYLFLIEIVCVVIGFSFSDDNLVFNKAIVVFLFAGFYSAMNATKVCKDYDEKELYERLKDKIDDEKIRAKEYKAIIGLKHKDKDTENENIKHEISNIFRFLENNCCYFVAFYHLSDKKLLFLLCAIGNIVLNVNVPNVSFIILTGIILDLEWEWLMLFYRTRGSSFVSFQMGTSALLMIFIRMFL